MRKVYEEQDMRAYTFAPQLPQSSVSVKQDKYVN
jgi:hypothetical protein